MKEAKFNVVFDGSTVWVGNLNTEAVEVWKEFRKIFPGENIMKFILMSENSMTMVKGELFYDVNLMDKDEIFNQLIDSL